MGRVPVAIAHDYLTARGGAERVVLALSRIFPQAPIHTLLYDPGATYPEFAGRTVVTSPLNAVPPLRRNYRAALPLLAPAASAMRIDADVTIASSSGWAHGFRPTGRMLVYCHNPARWLYQPSDYLGDGDGRSLKGAALSLLSPSLRRWDAAAASRADRYLANAAQVKARIEATYGIDADVVPPPPGLGRDGESTPPDRLAEWGPDGYWLVVSRLMPYKNVDLAIEAFRGRRERLVVVGSGPEKERLEQALPDNARIVSDVSDAELRWIYQHATALLAPSLEDFGLTPLEANGRGLPVLALRGGGYLETVDEGVSGLFFDELSPAAISEGVDRVAGHAWSVDRLHAHARAFGEDRFADRIRAEVAALASQEATRG